MCDDSLAAPGLEALQHLLDGDEASVATLTHHEFQARQQALVREREAMKVQVIHLQPVMLLNALHTV